jgi:hypothetical protein
MIHMKNKNKLFSFFGSISRLDILKDLQFQLRQHLRGRLNSESSVTLNPLTKRVLRRNVLFEEIGMEG